MIEDICGDGFVVYPFFIEGEAVYFEWKSFVCRGQLSHHHGEFFVHFWVFLDVIAEVFPENANIGEVSAVG